MLVFVALDEHTNEIHKRGERMGFILANTVEQRIEQRNEPMVLILRVWHEEQRRDLRPHLFKTFDRVC